MKYELTEEEMKAIVCARADLERAWKDLDRLFRPDSVILESIHNSLDKLTPIAITYYDKKSDAKAKHQYICNLNDTWDLRDADEIEAKLGIEHSIWTLHNVLYLDWNESHPWPSMKYVRVEDTIQEIRGKTWADLWIATDIAIARSETHRIFIESFYPSSEPFTLTVVLGS